MSGFAKITHERYLFHYTLMITKPVVYSSMNEVHRTGQTVRDLTEWSVIAPNEDYAHFAMMDNFGSKYRNVDPKVVHCTVTPVSGEITAVRFK